MPVSMTLKRSDAWLSSRRRVRSTRTMISPRSVNLIALLTRLESTWRSRCGSPTSESGTAGRTSTSSSQRFSCARRAKGFSVSSSIWRTEKSIDSMCSLPASIFEKSRTSLRITSSISAERCTVCR